jgi:hypothetical protein
MSTLLKNPLESQGCGLDQDHPRPPVLEVLRKGSRFFNLASPSGSGEPRAEAQRRGGVFELAVRVDKATLIQTIFWNYKVYSFQPTKSVARITSPPQATSPSPPSRLRVVPSLRPFEKVHGKLDRGRGRYRYRYRRVAGWDSDKRNRVLQPYCCGADTTRQLSLSGTKGPGANQDGNRFRSRFRPRPRFRQ